jgi:hypothetical protein
MMRVVRVQQPSKVKLKFLRPVLVTSFSISGKAALAGALLLDDHEDLCVNFG